MSKAQGDKHEPNQHYGICQLPSDDRGRYSVVPGATREGARWAQAIGHGAQGCHASKCDTVTQLRDQMDAKW